MRYVVTVDTPVFEGGHSGADCHRFDGIQLEMDIMRSVHLFPCLEVVEMMKR